MTDTVMDPVTRTASTDAPKIVIKLPEAFFPAWAIEKLKAAYPQADYVFWSGPSLGPHQQDAEVVIGEGGLTGEIVKQSPKLKYIQTISVGVEHFVNDSLRGWDGVVASGRGVNVSQLAEHAMAMMLTFARGLNELQRRQLAHKWLPGNGPLLPKLFELDGQRLCIIGYGEIGRAVAKRAKAFDMEVWALRRNPTGEADAHADRVLGQDQMDELVGAADHLLLVPPLTPETRGFFDAAKFAKMKPSAYFYNMGRGGLVDQDALIAAVRENRIAGAGLDCVVPEPLGAESPLWDLENVVLTAHTAGNTPKFLKKIMDHLADNLERYRKGDPLRSIVDVNRSY